eukprot:CAMPEP_0118851222 /NCGR_PEP_ID=MMETSP1163-20130328/748_1 /TAXON_ID=124430 /ORGANISM="Phaeomonas parva, Strain CCMP2877" /LENGTH=989 /DNA_ID=CAMNT_0006783523 /DNA_START=21 /DNA_END=2990 /DNA_ORIENTATION=-
MWEGVFVRCLLNILGVIMFLRLSWITGNAGIAITFAIILCSALVTSITTLSLSAICTNGEIAAGGLYFMISRSLGPEFGGAIGLTFFMANSVSVALYVVGFGEAMVLMLDEYAGGFLMASEAWDRTIYALIAMFCLTGVALSGGARLEIVLQKMLTVVMVLALLSFFVGVFLLDEDDEDRGLTALEGGGALADNVGPDFEPGVTWMTAFGVFFPAVTGIMAGANISGDLKEPTKAIPKGTLYAIGASTIIYLSMAFFLGAVTTRATLVDFENTIAVVEISAVPALVYAGIFAATLSSALAQLIGAPRILLAIAQDDLFPFLRPFAQTWGDYDEPLRGYIVTLFIGFVTTLAGDLNSISPLITNFFLLSYALVNYACCAATLGKSPGWRPGYRYWNPWVALLGAILCFAIMLTWWIAAAATLVICGGLYKYIELVSKPKVNWGSAGQAAMYLKAVDAVHRLEKIPGHVKNFRPEYLIILPKTTHVDHLHEDGLVHFTSHLNAGQGIVVVGHVILGTFAEDVALLQEARDVGAHNLSHCTPPIKALIDVVINPSYVEGVRMLLQLCGVGKLRPNTCMFHFPEHWRAGGRIQQQNKPAENKGSESDEGNGEASASRRVDLRIDVEDDAKASPSRGSNPGLEADADADAFVDVVRSAFGAGMGVCVVRKAGALRAVARRWQENMSAAKWRIPGRGDINFKEPLTPKRKMTKRKEVFAPESPKHSPSLAKSLRPIHESPPQGLALNPEEVKLMGEEDGPADGGGRQSGGASAANDKTTNSNSSSVRFQELYAEDLDVELALPATPRVDRHNSNGDLAAAARSIANIKAAEDVPTIDVWWLVDDGGLTILLPFLLRQHQIWRGARFRVLSISSKNKLTKEQSRMTRLLAKFRIDAEVVVVDRRTRNALGPRTVERFEHLSGTTLGNDAQARYFLNVSELIKEESSRATLVFVSLPIPRFAMPNARWLAYIDLLTDLEPPVVLVRGNQESVLTFYS